MPPASDSRREPAEDDSFPEVLRAAIASHGRSLESLKRRLEERGSSVSIATLSYWQTGRSRPQRAASLQALAHLEEILWLPRNYLTSRLGLPRRPGGRPREVAVSLLADSNPAMDAAMDAIGCTPPLDLVDLTVHLTLDVDAVGNERLLTVRHVVRATRDGVVRMPAMLAVDRPDGGEAQFRALSGCTVGRQVSLVEDGVYAAELVFERPLREGEVAAVDHEMVFPASHVSDHFHEYYAVRRVNECMLWVRFDPEAPPARIEAYQEVDGVRRSEVVHLRQRSSVQHIVRKFGPGRVGVSWQA